MTGSYCMPIGGNSTPVIYQQDKSNHHLLGSALLGGAAAYGAYKLNLDIIKDSMSASAFEDAIRSGKKIEIPSLTRDERNLLNQARKDAAVLSDSQICSMFGKEDSKTTYDYLSTRYKDKNIHTAQDLEDAIERMAKDSDNAASSSSSATSKAAKKVDKLAELKAGLKEISDYEKTILDASERKTKLTEEIATLQKEKDTAEGGRIKEIETQLAKKERELKQANFNLGKATTKKNQAAQRVMPLLKPENINAEHAIKQQAGSGYKDIQALRDDISTTDSKLIRDAAERRNAFIEEYGESLRSEHNEALKSRPKASENLAMKADLELVRAAEAGDCYVTKSMAQEAYQKLGAEAGKGEASIAKAFEALGKKLPGAGSWKRAGLLGGVVALGLYCFNT